MMNMKLTIDRCQDLSALSTTFSTLLRERTLMRRSSLLTCDLGCLEANSHKTDLIRKASMLRSTWSPKLNSLTILSVITSISHLSQQICQSKRVTSSVLSCVRILPPDTGGTQMQAADKMLALERSIMALRLLTMA